MTADVVVCGAGVAGLAAAHALSRRGLRVLVLDRRAAPADVAKGELLQPEAVRILDGWGVLAPLLDAGAVAVDRLAIRDPAGAPLMDLAYGVLPGPYRQILCTGYTTVLRVLERRLDPATVRVRRGVLVDGLLRDAAGRVTGVRTATADGPGELPARLVVAADGLSSRLRRAAGLPVRRRPYDHRLLAFEVRGARVAPEVCAYLTGGGLRLVYPLPAAGGVPRCRVYVQVGEDELREGVLADLDGWCERLLASLPALAPIAGGLRDGARGRQVLAVCRLRAPRLTAPGLALVGEAAHAVHPMAAQGMNCSVADAEALASAIGGDAGGRAGGDGGRVGAELDRALAAYHAARRARLDHTDTVSHNAARMLTLTTGPGRRLGHRMMRRTAANPRLLRITAGNLAGVDVHPLTPVDRLYQLGLLTDRAAQRCPAPATVEGASP